MHGNLDKNETVICGAGIAGIATAYFLSVHHGWKEIMLVDRGQPMAYTTSKTGDNYRDYWPQQCMTSFARRSITLMEALAEETDNCFDFRRNGYNFVSFQRDREIFPSEHLRKNFDSGQLEQITGGNRLRSQFPYLSEKVEQVVHIRRAGPMDVYALGSYLLSRARETGVRFHSGHIQKITHDAGKFRVQTQQQNSSNVLSANQLVLTAGPMNKNLAAMLGAELNLHSILQRKFVMPDPDQVIPRDMPYTIFADPQFLHWNQEERKLMEADPDYQWLLDEFPTGLHIKPESSRQIKLGWAYNREPEEPRWQAEENFDFPNVVLKGASQFIPGLADYAKEPPTPVQQLSGYYTRTPENWPVIGPLEEHEGLFTVSALSGYGTMMACAAGELVAQWMTGDARPDFAAFFHPRRYEDADIMAEIDKIESDGQL